MQLELEIKNGMIEELRLYSDAMAWPWTKDVHELEGTAYRQEAFLPKWKAYLEKQNLEDAQRDDLYALGLKAFA